MSLRPVAVYPVRINSLTERFQSKSFQVIVGVARICINTLLVREDRNWENRSCVELSNSVQTCFQKPLCNQSSLCRGIPTQINGCEWSLHYYRICFLSYTSRGYPHTLSSSFSTIRLSIQTRLAYIFTLV